MNWRAFGEAAVTLTVIMDPLGNAPIFVALTSGRSRHEVRRLVVAAVGAAAALIIGFALFGEVVLRYLNVSVDALSIAGGLLLLLVALDMMQGEDVTMGSTESTLLVPLATPLLAGPGAIASVMVLSRQHDTSGGRVGVIAGILVAVLVVGVALLGADLLARLVRPSVVHFLTRVFGLLLAAIAVELIAEGVVNIANNRIT